MSMLILGIAEHFPKHKSSKPRWIAFVVSWLVSASILILYAWKVYQVDDLVLTVIVFSIIAIFPAWVLPRLQSRYPVIVAALIVGFFWALWHLPIDIGNGVPAAWILENRLVWNPVVAILMTWLYNRTNGSILAPVLFHSAMNAFGNQFSIITAGNVLFLGLTIHAIVYDRMWEKLPFDHPAVYRESEMINLEKAIIGKTSEVSHV